MLQAKIEDSRIKLPKETIDVLNHLLCHNKNFEGMKKIDISQPEF